MIRKPASLEKSSRNRDQPKIVRPHKARLTARTQKESLRARSADISRECIFSPRNRGMMGAGAPSIRSMTLKAAAAASTKTQTMKEAVRHEDRRTALYRAGLLPE